jgi:cytochrome c553
MNALPKSLLIVALLLTAAAAARAQSFTEKYAVCAGCHGENGQSELPETPSLGAQPTLFTTYQLFYFRGGQRGESPMTEIAKGMSDNDLRLYAEGIAKLPPPKPPQEGRDSARFARGKAIAERLACHTCHNPDYSGREQMPRLVAQREDYLILAMRQYKAGKRIGQMAMMPEIMHSVSETDIPALAHFFAYLP